MAISARTAESNSAPSGKSSKTASYFAAFVALGLTNATLGPTLPGLAEHTQTQLSQISFLFTARSLGYLIGSYFGGRLYDRLVGHMVMAFMIIIMTATLLLVPLMSLLWLLILVLILLGIAEGSLDVGGNTLLIWVHRHKVGPFMNALHFFFGVGAFLSPIIIAQTVLISGDITWAYWILAFLILPVAFLFLRLPSPIVPKNADDSSVADVNYRLVGLIALFFLLDVGAELSFGGWIFTYSIALNLTGETAAAYLTSAFWGSLTVGRLLSVPLANHFRPRFVLIADLTGSIISVGVILLWSDSLVAVWIGTLGVGLAMASSFPVMLSFAARRMRITGQITGLFFVGASIGGMTIPWLIGQLFEPLGPRIMMIIILIALSLTLTVVGTLIGISKVA